MHQRCRETRKCDNGVVKFGKTLEVLKLLLTLKKKKKVIFGKEKKPIQYFSIRIVQEQ